jgi:hypothetical protein
VIPALYGLFDKKEYAAKAQDAPSIEQALQPEQGAQS